MDVVGSLSKYADNVDIVPKLKSMRSNNALERTCNQGGRAVLAMDGVLAGAEWAPCQAAQRDR